MITLEEYEQQMDSYMRRLDLTTDKDSLLEEIGEFQINYMTQVQGELYLNNELITDSLRIIIDAISYLITCSTSGNVIVSTHEEKIAEETKETCFEYIGDYLLDVPQVYKNNDNMWCIDFMFGGYYCPYWDGFYER